MDGLLWFVVIGAAFYLIMRAGCGAQTVHGHAGRGADVEAVDPVCGMPVEPDKGYAKAYQGVIYRFCSRSCLDKFDDNPARYLNSATDDGEGGP